MPTESLKLVWAEEGAEPPSSTATKKKKKTTPKKTTPKKKASSKKKVTRAKVKTTGEGGESTVGIRQQLRGWQARAWYHSNDANLGTYKNRDDAVLALKVGQEYLETTRNLQLTVEEIKSNKNSAKVAAMEAVERNGGEINTKSKGSKLVISKLDSRYIDDNVTFKVLPEHVDFYANIVSISIDDRSYLEHVVNAMATINENHGCNRKQIMNYINDKFSEDKEEAPNKRINTFQYINTSYELSNEMADFVGKDNLTVKEVQSAVWDYTTKHCKPIGGAGRGAYTLDETMRSLLGTLTVSITTMASVSLNVCVLFVCEYNITHNAICVS